MNKYIKVENNVVTNVYSGETQPDGTQEVPYGSPYRKGDDVREFVDHARVKPNLVLLEALQEIYPDTKIILNWNKLVYADVEITEDVINQALLNIKKTFYISMAQSAFEKGVDDLKKMVLGYVPTVADLEGLRVKMLLATIVAERDSVKLSQLALERGQAEDEVRTSMELELETYYAQHKLERGTNAKPTLVDYANYVVDTGAWWKVVNGKFFRITMNVRNRILFKIGQGDFDYVDDMFEFAQTTKAEGATLAERVNDIVTKVENKLSEDV